MCAVRNNDYANAAVAVNDGMQKRASALLLSVLVHTGAALKFVDPRSQATFEKSLRDGSIQRFF